MCDRLFVVIFWSLLFSACDSPKTGEFFRSDGVEDYRRVDTQALESREQWVFNGVLKGLNSKEHFVLEGQFLANVGQVKLYSHFNDFRWRDGVLIGLRLEEQKMFMQIGVPGFAVREEDLPAIFLRSDGRFKMRIEVHNAGIEGVRVLVWKYGYSKKGEVETIRPFIDETNADFDSMEQGMVFTDHGRGVKWGIEFENARIIQAFREAPYAL